MIDLFKKMRKYALKHPEESSFAHAIAGLGMGLLAYGFLGASAVLIGWGLLGIGVLWHAYAFMQG